MRRSGFKRKYRPNKFKARKTWRDNQLFDSKLEANAYSELKLLEKGGLISELETQKEFDLRVNDKRICMIYPDFFFYDNEMKVWVVGEAKGKPTPEWRIKWKLLQALHPEYDYRMYTQYKGWE